MINFKYVELFAGIGGFRQALDKIGGECVMASEIDKYASQAYSILYGDEHLYGDVTKIDENSVPEHDLLVFGFPCQAFSVAGKRLGFEDTRGTLFFEAARIAKAKKPKILLGENVKGLISHDKGKTLDTIIQTLADIGYTVDFNVLNSKYFGVPQNRERVFIVAIRDDLIKPQAWDVGKRTDVVAKGKRRISELEGIKTFNFDWPEQEEVTTRLRDILESDVDERFYLSEDKTAKLVVQLESQNPSVTDEIKCFNPRNVDTGEQTRMQDRVYDTDGTSVALTAGFSERMNVVEPQMLGHIDLKGHDAIKRVYSTEGVSPTLTTMGGGHREPKIAEEQPRLNIVGHSGSGGQKGHIYATDGLMSCLTATDYKQPKQIVDEVSPVLTPDRLEKRQNGRRFKDDGEESFTLTAQDRHGIAIREATQKGYAVACEGDAVNIQFPGSTTRRGRVGKQIAQTLEASGVNQGVVTTRYRIRKLTPLECFRLQGFPDSEFEKLAANGMSNSQLYKMAGNAVTVNVIDAIGRRLLPLLR